MCVLMIVLGARLVGVFVCVRVVVVVRVLVLVLGVLVLVGVVGMAVGLIGLVVVVVVCVGTLVGVILVHGGSLVRRSALLLERRPQLTLTQCLDKARLSCRGVASSVAVRAVSVMAVLAEAGQRDVVRFQSETG